MVDSYFSSPWGSAEALQLASPMPIALNMQKLYELLMRSVITEPAKPGESLAEQITRLGQLRNLSRQLEALTGQLVREKQFTGKWTSTGK